MPLVWAHAEFIKLLTSRQLGHPYDRPHATWLRYQGNRPVIQHAIWLPQDNIETVTVGQTIYIATLEPCIVHWGTDGWHSIQNIATHETSLGLHIAQLETSTLLAGQRIDFTFRRMDTGDWLDRDYAIEVKSG